MPLQSAPPPQPRWRFRPLSSDHCSGLLGAPPCLPRHLARLRQNLAEVQFTSFSSSGAHSQNLWVKGLSGVSQGLFLLETSFSSSVCILPAPLPLYLSLTLQLTYHFLWAAFCGPQAAEGSACVTLAPWVFPHLGARQQRLETLFTTISQQTHSGPEIETAAELFHLPSLSGSLDPAPWGEQMSVGSFPARRNSLSPKAVSVCL